MELLTVIAVYAQKLKKERKSTSRTVSRAMDKNKWFKNKTQITFVLASLLFTCLVGSSIMWFTDIYYDEIINQMTIREGSEVFDAWRKPPVKPLICVHVFNYTNIEAYKKGIEKKIKIQEVGPYCYRESLEKKNVTFNDDGTVTYGDTRSHVFEPEHSKGKRDDILYVPNLALIAAVAMTKDMNRFTQIGISYFMKVVLRYSDTMIRVKAHEFLFGYNDRLVEVGKKVATVLQRKVPFEKFGILSQRAANTDETTTVRTGTNDVERIGIVTQINGMEELDAWSDDECNRIDGSDGAFFPRHTINETATLYLFHKNICRRMPFVYYKEVNFQDDVMAMRFQAAPDVYNTNGTCFCPETGCAPNGVFDLSPCSEGIPLLISFPHFLYAESSVTDPFEGLSPNPEKHEFYIDIQRMSRYIYSEVITAVITVMLLGFTLGTVSRLQINIRVEKSKYTTLVKEFPNNIILPVVWIQVSAEEMPPELYKIIYHATFTVKRMKVILMWVSLICTLVVAYFLVSYIRCIMRPKKSSDKKMAEYEKAQSEEMLPMKVDIQICKVPVPTSVVA